MDKNYILEETAIGIKVSLDFIEGHLERSMGQPTMSDEDVKSSILHLKLALGKIGAAFEALAEEPEPKKTFMQKLLRK